MPPATKLDAEGKVYRKGSENESAAMVHLYFLNKSKLADHDAFVNIPPDIDPKAG